MSKLWGEITKATSIGMQYVKEKAGAAKAEVNPEYEVAIERYDILNERFSTFFADLKTVMEFFGLVFQSGVEISQELDKADKAAGSTSAQFVQLLLLFFERSKNSANNLFISNNQQYVVESLQKILDQLNHLGQIRNKRRKHQLLCDSLKNDIENLSKGGNAERLTKAKIQYEQTKDKMNQETIEFITSVNQIWQGRVIILESALQDFIRFSYQFAMELNMDLQGLTQSLIPPSLPQPIFPVPNNTQPQYYPQMNSVPVYPSPQQGFFAQN